jgi:hypothetical protein
MKAAPRLAALLVIAACRGDANPASTSTSDPGRPSPSEQAAAGHDCVGQATAYAAAVRAATRACQRDADCGCAVTSLLASVTAPGLTITSAAAVADLAAREQRFVASGCRRDFAMGAAVCAPVCVAGACAAPAKP